MKIWLDDERPVPDSSWKAVRWPEEVIALLEQHGPNVLKISLDHDLGDVGSNKERTGKQVLDWIEEQVVLYGYHPPLIYVHTANPVARQVMCDIVARIYAVATLLMDKGGGCESI